ncbi:DUF2508 family protein [Haloimpatiens lingqiaonensis]|uniref:DUF2508 family protein n=1 Tax=Haloimpatiens lingqiaonensis TaxID=1380675 RepID=UPI0010FD1037|nr:DUF2508 family protein [Haloimpatiens lingqiaonensis]
MKDKSFEENMFSRIKYTEEQKVIIRALEIAIKELEYARELFETADNPNLIDYAIYREAAANAKYAYLLNQAKSKNIRINSYIIQGNDRVV